MAAHVSLAYRAGLLRDLVPDISKANDIGEAAFIAVAHAFTGVPVLGLTATIAAAAWQFAAQTDSALGAS